MSDDPRDRKSHRYYTPIGVFTWTPNQEAVEELLYKPLAEALSTVKQKDDQAGISFTLGKYLGMFLKANHEDSVQQAAQELIAVIKALETTDQHERYKIGKAAATKAQQASMARLRRTHLFQEVGRGNKKSKTLRAISKKYDLEASVVEAIKLLMRKQPNKDPSMVDVAEKLGRAKRRTDAGHPTGRKSLATSLKNLHKTQKQTGRQIFDELKKRARREQNEEE